MTTPPNTEEIALSDVARGWWPLALSWMLMGVELPLLAAVVARLAEPEIHLAAYGGLVFPIALLIEAPIIMMLTASTALSKHRAAYDALRRTTHRLGLGLTILHLAFAITPLFDVVLVALLDTPPAVIEPARLGLLLMTPWTWAIASRRFNQGVLIRYGRSRQVTAGSIVRLAAGALTLAIGYHLAAPGIVVATATVIVGVLVEAAYAAAMTRSIVRQRMEPGDPSTVLRGRPFLRFYVPLALTPLVTLAVQTIGAAALSRMPRPLESLALWPVLGGLLFLLQSAGFALTEVVVAMLERRGAPAALLRFALLLTAGLTLIALAVVTTPLAELWFGVVSGLRVELVELAVAALWWGLLIPGARALASWYGGVLVAGDRTRALTESVVIFLAICAGILSLGIASGGYPGIIVGIFAFACARLAETLWLAWRSRDLRLALARRIDAP